MKSLHNVIRRPILTEKSLGDQQNKNVYTFEVDSSANKIEIRKAIQDAFQVTVVKVTTTNRKGKRRRVRFVEGRRKDWKKAMVTLKKGDLIELT